MNRADRAARVKGVLLVPIAAAPSVMLAASAAERRLGPAVAGWLVAAPFSLAIALVALGPTSGPVAASAAAHVPAQVAFALAFGLTVRRGALAGFTAGAFAYLAAAAVLPQWAGLALAVPALALAARVPLARRTVTEGPGGAPQPRPRAQPGELVLRATVGAVFVAVVCTASAVAGPQAAGAVAAFPAMSGSLALLVHRARGADAAAGVLQGLVHGLAGYFAFATAVALVAPSPAAVPVGIVACGAVARVAWTAVRPRAAASAAAAAV